MKVPSAKLSISDYLAKYLMILFSIITAY